MLGTQKRKYILGGSQNRTDPNKRSKLQTPDTDSDDETDDEEKDLEAFLFGSNSDLLKETIEESTCNSHNNIKEEDTQDKFLGFTISTKPDEDNAPKEDDIQFLVNKEESKAAWSDDDDANVKVNISSVNRIKKLKEHTSEKHISGNKFQQRLKSQFEKILPTPAWADLENASVNDSAFDSDDAEENILLSSKRATVKSKELPQGTLSISKLKNLNQLKASSSTITSLEFHPHSKIAFTTSLNKRLNIFQTDGRENRKLQSIFLANFPIYAGHFTPDGDKVIATSRRKFFYVYDLLEGKVVKVPEIRGRDEKSLETFQVSPDGEIIAFLGNNGYINLVSSKTFHLISSLKMNGGISTAAFTSDGSRLYSAGSDGEVYIWNIKQRKCEHRFFDDGSLKTKSIAVSRDQKYIATGSTSGIVNIYDKQCLTQKYPNPIRILKNLTTSVDGVSFNSTRFDINFEQCHVNFQSDLDDVKIDAESEILGYYSPQARNSIRLVHFPSLTNFSNWPIERQTLGNVSCIGFSPNSGYMGVGNEKGQALLFRLKHYPSS